jgi:DNA repair photolyase
MQKPVNGRGATVNQPNRFLKNSLVFEHLEGLDEEKELGGKTEFYVENPKKIINKVASPDVGLAHSMNPYQGCEHGCIYCYARNSHEYWGFSAGMDFEQKIIVKKNAAEILEKDFDKKSYVPRPIMLAGNTDCYQPAERKFGITRKLLKVLLRYRHPVSIITKNTLVTRDLDILKVMNEKNLVHVNISINSLDESVRLKLEPRTASGARRMEVVEKLSAEGIPVRVLVAPVIPSLNNHEIPEIVKQAAERGAASASYIVVRLNGAIGNIFTEWVRHHFPDRAEKVLNQIKELHAGKLNDSEYGRRMAGEGALAESIAKMFKVSYARYFKGRKMPELDLSHFCRPEKGQLKLF